MSQMVHLNFYVNLTQDEHVRKYMLESTTKTLCRNTIN